MIYGKPRYLGLLTVKDDTEYEKGSRLLIQSARGVEVGIVAGLMSGEQVDTYRASDSKQENQGGDSAMQDVNLLHVVTEDDLQRERANRADEDQSLIIARQLLTGHKLDMKLVDVEYMNDRKKLFLYFTSEQRIDFRAYVRDLAREFRTRIELRQIGVRDEAKVVKGIGACGRECCCTYWLQRFMPIGIKMVKEQNLALNPTKISGLCGRLMCCMSYEQDNYRKLWKRLPSQGSKIKTANGNWILLGVGLADETCTLHGPRGYVTIPIDMFKEFKETVTAGEEWSNEEHGLDARGHALENADTARNDRFSATFKLPPCLRSNVPVSENKEKKTGNQSDGDKNVSSGKNKDKTNREEKKKGHTERVGRRNRTPRDENRSGNRDNRQDNRERSARPSKRKNSDRSSTDKNPAHEAGDNRTDKRPRRSRNDKKRNSSPRREGKNGGERGAKKDGNNEKKRTPRRRRNDRSASGDNAEKSGRPASSNNARRRKPRGKRDNRRPPRNSGNPGQGVKTASGEKE